MSTEQQRDPQGESEAKGEQGIKDKVETSPTRRSGYPLSGPFALMRRLSEDMDRLWGGLWGAGINSPEDWTGQFGALTWPVIDVCHEGGKLKIHADVPGLKKEDVTVEVRDRELCISGERRSESERNERGYYRTERSYGRFHRSIPLPEGAKVDTASATFENGVLTIEMEAPEQQRGRRIDVRTPGQI